VNVVAGDPKFEVQNGNEIISNTGGSATPNSDGIVQIQDGVAYDCIVININNPAPFGADGFDLGIGVCMPDPPTATPVCPVDLYQWSKDGICQVVYKDANDVFFEKKTIRNNMASVGDPLFTGSPICGTVNFLEANALSTCDLEFTCDVAPVTMEFLEPVADGCQYFQRWEGVTETGNTPDPQDNWATVFTGMANGLPAHPAAPTESGQQCNINFLGDDNGLSLSNNNPDDQVQFDAWVLVPPAVECVNFRIGANSSDHSVALFVGTGLNDMQLLVEDTDGTQGNTPDGSAKAYTIPPTVATTNDDCGWKILRTRIYVHDEDVAFNAQVEWSFTGGIRWDPVPATYIQSATGPADDTPPVGPYMTNVVGTENALLDEAGNYWKTPNNCNKKPTTLVEPPGPTASTPDHISLTRYCVNIQEDPNTVCDPCQMEFEELGCACQEEQNMFANAKPNSVTAYYQTLIISSEINNSYTILSTTGISGLTGPFNVAGSGGDDKQYNFFVTPGVPYSITVMGDDSGVVKTFYGECPVPDDCNCPPMPEVCGDNLDNDCDGLVDANDPDILGDCNLDCDATPVEIQGKVLKTDGFMTHQIWSKECGNTACCASSINPHSCALAPFTLTDANGLPAHQNGAAGCTGNDEFRSLGSVERAHPQFYSLKAEQAQLDGWIVLPPGVTCFSLKVNHPRAWDAQALYLGGGIANMNFVGASSFPPQNNYTTDDQDATGECSGTTQGSTIYEYDTQDPANGPHTTITVDGCTWTIVRARAYIFDESFFHVTPVQWNIGEGFVNIPSQYLQSVGPNGWDTDDNKPTAADVMDTAPFCAYQDADGDLFLQNGEFYALDVRKCEKIVNNDCLNCPPNLTACVIQNGGCTDPVVVDGMPVQDYPKCDLEVYQVTPKVIMPSGNNGLTTIYWDHDQANCTSNEIRNESIFCAFNGFNDNPATCPNCLPQHPDYGNATGTVVLGTLGVRGSDLPQDADNDNFKIQALNRRSGENAQQDGWLLVPPGVDCITFRLSSLAWDAGALYLGTDIDNMTMVGENVNSHGENPVDTFYYEIPANAPMVSCPECVEPFRYLRVRTYHHDNNMGANTVWEWDIGNGFVNVPEVNLFPVNDQCDNTPPAGCPTIGDGPSFLAVKDEDGKWFDYASFPGNLSPADVDPATQKLNVLVDRIFIGSCDVLEPVCNTSLQNLDTKGICQLCIIPGLSKTISGIAPAASGIAGNVDITFKFTLTNTGGAPMMNHVIQDDFTVIPGFVGVSVPPSTFAPTGNAVPANPNLGYAGTGNLLDGMSGLLANGDTYMAQVTVEFDASEIPQNFTNTAQGGTIVDGVPILDDSDSGLNPDPNDPNTGAEGDTGGTNDPTPLYIPSINASKAITAFAPAASGVPGNVDATFEITVCNTGNVDLENITLVDDLTTQMGAAFVGVLTPPVVTASTATMTPSVNSNYNGAGDINIFTGNDGYLAPGQCVTVEFTAELDPNANPGATNQATTSGKAINPNGGPLTDLNGNQIMVMDDSDSGTDPNGQNPNDPGDTGGSNDPTALSIPQIALTKNFVDYQLAASGVVGNVDVTIEYNILNTGSVNLMNLSLIDDFATNFGTAYVGVVTPAVITNSTATTDPNLNAGFNGTGNNDMFDGMSGLLEPNQMITVQIVIELDPNAPGSNFPDVNQATTSGDGVGPNGSIVTVSDDSDDGVNPESPNNGEPGDTGGTNDPSPFNIPLINLSKDYVNIVPAQSNVPGNVDITISLKIENTGNVNLSNINLIDDLAANFGSTLVGIVVPPAITASDATMDPVLNPGYNGTGNNNIFDGMSGLLEPSQMVTVEFTIEIDPNAPGAPDPLENQASTSGDGIGPNGTVITVNDDSDSGNDPESNNPNQPGDTGGQNDPTPIPAPAMEIAKNIAGVDCATSGTPGNIDIIYQVVVQNVGNVVLTNFSLIDDMMDFGTAFVAVVEQPTIVAVGANGNVTNANVNPATNPNFSGDGDDLLAGGGELDLGQLFVVQYRIEINTNNLGNTPSNQINGSAEGLGFNGVPITIEDQSDSGFIPESTNPDRPGDTGSSDDPTPLTNCWDLVSNGIACNDLVNVSMDENCNAGISADMIVEGHYGQCDLDVLPLGGYYDVSITDAIGTPLTDADPSTPNFFDIDGSYLGQTLVVSVTEVVYKTSCWGEIKFEDKTGPTIDCQDIQISCSEELVDVPFATAMDNCTPVLVDLVGETQIDDDACDDNMVKFLRTYIAVDDFGNESALCEQTISIVRPTDVDFPNDIIWTCDQYNAYPNIVEATMLHPFVGDSDPTTQIIEVALDETCDDADNNPNPNCTFLNLNDDDPTINSTSIANGGPGCPGASDCVAGTNGGLDDADVLELTGSGRPENIVGTYCMYNYEHSDALLDACGPGFKIVRTWVVLDWCSGQVITSNQAGEDNIQVIKVMDLKAPEVSIAPYTVSIDVDANGQQYCASTAKLQDPIVSDNCSGWTVSIMTPAGIASNGFIPSPGLPVGDHIVTYIVSDDCGNTTEVPVTVTVVDDQAPEAICDEITTVSISSDGKSVVDADVFDDGSHDNCCIDHFEVRRMDAGCGTGTNFGPTVTFCCDDIQAGSLQVAMQVVDCYGNTNQCMVSVIVEDKLPPVVVKCPAQQVITCDKYWEELEVPISLGDYTALNQFGTPEFFDNCSVNISENNTVNIDECGNGTISRTWQATDDSGNGPATCTQIIRVNHVSDFVVEFPADKVVECTDDVPDFGEPQIFFETCELVATSYTDQYFDVVPDACYKIQRIWTVINWCVVGDDVDQEVVEVPESAMPAPYNDLDQDGIKNEPRVFRDSWNGLAFPGADDAGINGAPDTDPDLNPWDGFITYEQIIKVKDSVKPQFTNGCEVPDVCIEDNSCAASVSFPNPDVTDCSTDITVTVQSDLGAGFGPFNNVGPGTYTVTYTATDNCGNTSNCQTTFEVKDCKKPTPYCKNGLVIELMQTGMVDTWASDFDAGSFDNCPGDLAISFSSDVNDTQRIFNCDHVGQQNLEIWVTDAAGNQDFCNTFVIVQDNMNICPNDDDPLIAGQVATEDNEFVQNVILDLSGDSNSSFTTGTNGQFTFNSVPAGGDYTITPEKDVDPLNGVTTYDLVLITKHILGVKPLDSPYKMIAADVNKSETITTFDLVQLRKLILFVDDNFQNNTSWRFVDADYQFPNPQNPWEEAFPEVINLNNLTADELNADFVAVKVGDVNGNADPLGFTNADDRNAVGRLVFETTDRELVAGETYTVNFKVNDSSVQGYQFTMNFDQNALKFVGLNDGFAKSENIGLALLEEGAITTSWNGNTQSNDAFSLTFEARQNVRLSDVLDINSRYTPAEAYDRQGELLEVELHFDGVPVQTNFELYQNTPNPFAETTKIGFTLPEATAATITITDVSGKVLRVIEGDFAKGYNEVRLTKKDLNATGVLYYRLETDTNTATKKMILMN